MQNKLNKSSKNDNSQNPEITTLRRIDRKHIWGEISSVLSLEKGIFYTIKELFIRPGKTVTVFLLYDRKKIVRPIIFVIITSLIFLVTQNILGFQTGTATDDIGSKGVQNVYEWVMLNFGLANIVFGVFISFWIRLFYLRSQFNIYEIFVLVFYMIGFGNLIFTLFGIFESTTGVYVDNLAYLTSLLYATWAIGSFFNKKSFWSYFKALFAYIFGTTTGPLLIVLVGNLIDAINK